MASLLEVMDELKCSARSLTTLCLSVDDKVKPLLEKEIARIDKAHEGLIEVYGAAQQAKVGLELLKIVIQSR